MDKLANVDKALPGWGGAVSSSYIALQLVFIVVMTICDVQTKVSRRRMTKRLRSTRR